MPGLLLHSLQVLKRGRKDPLHLFYARILGTYICLVPKMLTRRMEGKDLTEVAL